MRTRKGTRPQNILPLRAGGADTNWIDLIAAPVERSTGKIYISKADKKQRMLQSALRRLADENVQLTLLPHHDRKVGKYEGFQLLDEGGRRQDGEAIRYSIPKDDEPVFNLPVGLFKNGWIHFLEDSEIAFILMLSHRHAIEDTDKLVKIYSGARIDNYGIGRDSYASHETLRRLGLLQVETEAERRGLDIHKYWQGKERLHKFRLIDDGFHEAAVDVIKDLAPLRLF